jgi:hypothetical protein
MPAIASTMAAAKSGSTASIRASGLPSAATAVAIATQSSVRAARAMLKASGAMTISHISRPRKKRRPPEPTNRPVTSP